MPADVLANGLTKPKCETLMPVTWGTSQSFVDNPDHLTGGVAAGSPAPFLTQVTCLPVDADGAPGAVVSSCVPTSAVGGRRVPGTMHLRNLGRGEHACGAGKGIVAAVLVAVTTTHDRGTLGEDPHTNDRHGRCT